MKTINAIVLAIIAVCTLAVVHAAEDSSSMSMESLTGLSTYDVLPINERLTPLERSIVANHMPEEQARVLLQIDSENQMEQENENENENENEMESESDSDAESEVDDTAALEVQGTEEATSNTVNFLELDADVENPLYAAARDETIDASVRTFLKRSALRSESEELAQLEAGQLQFDSEGNDVLLEHSPAGTFDDNVEGALRKRIEDRWKAEGYYQNPQAEFHPREDDAGSFLEMTAVQHSEADSETETDAESDEAVDAEAEAELESEGESESESESEDSTEFLQIDPEAIKAHKEGHIGKMRHIRTRAKRIQNRRLTKPAAEDSRNGVGLDSFGPYDERRDSEESRHFSADTEAGLDAERKQRLGTVRAVGLSRAPFCSTFPFCKQTPPPPEMTNLPPNENPEILRQEMARLDPLVGLPVKLEELKKDPHRFGVVFQSIYDRNSHNEKLKNKMAGA